MTISGREEQFADRLMSALDKVQRAPAGHGRQKWLRDQVEEGFNQKLSPEAVRKWFAGEARPRPKTMRMVAKVLDVDEAWLSLGLQPDVTQREKAKRSAAASGAVNLVAGHIQLAGGNIAFPDDEEDVESEDVFAIVRGKRHSVTVRLGNVTAQFKLTVTTKAETNTIIVAIPTKDPLVYEFVRVPTETLQAHGKARGGYIEFSVNRKGDTFYIESDPLPRIRTFSNLAGALDNAA